ncbi:MAG TPA: hypothetical protein VKE94_05550 [Gemmataceae bacterium]|nr:hypothetical protein [Gemmataceae bacterium]
MKMFDKTGTSIEVPDDQVQAAYQSGQYALAPGSKIPMKGTDGTGYVDSADFGKALDEGQSVMTPDEVAQVKREQWYGNTSGQVLAGAAGLARGLTGGASDVALVEGAKALGGEKWGKTFREELQGAQEINPTLSTGSEVVGALAPFAAVGKAGAVARGAGAIPRGIAAAGDIAGGAVGKGIVAAIGEGAASRIASTAVSGAVQGGIAGVGMAASEAELGNTELTGEKLLAAVGHGALLGGATGGALQATGEMGSYILGRMHPFLSGQAEENAWRALNPRKALVADAERIPGGGRGVGRRLLDEGLVEAGDTVETLAPKLEAATKDAGEEVGAIYKRADAAGYKGPRVGDILDRAEKDITKDLRKLGITNKSALNAVQGVSEDLANFAVEARGAQIPGLGQGTLAHQIDAIKDLHLTFEEAKTFRSMLDEHIRFNTNPLGPVNEKAEALKKLRGIIKSTTDEAGEVAAKGLGGTFKKDLEAANLRYRQLKVASDTANDAVQRAAANNTHSLTDQITGAATLAGTAGHMVSAAAAHGVGHALLPGLGSLASGYLASKGHQLIRTHGNSVAAVFFDKAAAIGGINRAQGQVKRQIQRGVAGLFGPARAGQRVKTSPHAGNYQQAVTAVSTAANSASHLATVSGAVAPLAPHAPQVTNAFERAALRATSFLASKIPPGHQDTGALQPKFAKPRVTDAEQAKFLRYVQAVHDPLAVLQDMKSGSITNEQIEALRSVYPELYGEVRQEVMAALHAPKAKQLSYGEEQRIKRLFGIQSPEDKQMTKLMQDNFQVNAVNGKGGGGPKGGGSGAPAIKAPGRPLQDAGNYAKLAGLQPSSTK